MFSLSGKVALVTGGAKGIGQGIAVALAQAGADVVVGDLSAEECKATVEQVKALGRRGLAVKCDVSKKEDADGLVAAAVKEFGRADILVNNAGIYPFQPALEITEAQWDKVQAVNLKGTFMCSQAFARHASQRGGGGKIVNISSIAAKAGFSGLSHYCASKGGVNALTRALALELAPLEINVNAIEPGPIETPGTGGLQNPKQREATIALIPWRRVGLPADIAGAVVYLASQEADFVTGAILAVDGGYTIP